MREGVGGGAAWLAASVLVSLARKEKRAHASWCRRVTDVVHLARVPSMERRRLLTCLLACVAVVCACMNILRCMAVVWLDKVLYSAV